MKSLLLTLGLCISQLSHATIDIDALNWTLKEEKDEIQILSAVVPESDHHAYLAVTIIHANTDDLVEIIRNPAQCSQWVYRCEQSYLYRQEKANVDLVYSAIDMPFPLKHRDTLARISWKTDPVTKVVTAIGIATDDVLEQIKDQVRIDSATVIWELTPLTDGTTQVRTYGHIDPGGEIPAWLSNSFSTEAPLKTLAGLREMASR